MSLRKRRRISVAVYLCATFAFCLAVVGGLLAYTTAVAFAQDRREAERTAAQAAKNIAAEIARANASLGDTGLAFFTTIPGVRELDPARCQQGLGFMSGIGDAHGTLVRADGTIVCSSRQDWRSAADVYRGAAWLPGALATNETKHFSADRDPLTGAAASVWLRGFDTATGRRAVMITSFGMGYYAEQWKEDSALGTDVSLIDERRATVLASSIEHARWAGSVVPAAFTKPLDGARTLRGVDGVERIYAESMVPGEKWIVLAGLPRDRAYATAFDALRRSLVSGGAVAAVVLLLGVLLFRRIARPLRALTNAIEAAGTRDREIAAPVAGPSELAKTAEAFNRTIESRRRTEERFSALVEHTSDAIAVVDHSGRIAWASPAGKRMFGDEIVGTALTGLAHEEDRRSLETILRPRPAGDTCAVEFRTSSSAAGARYVEAIANDLRHDPAVDGVVLVARDVTERKAFEDHLAHQAMHDPLTGLANRALALDRLGHVLPRGGVAVLFMDLDRFKLVNDAHGHAAGDAVLVALADRLRVRMRPGDTVARFGGDEFVAVCERVHSGPQALSLARRLAHTLDDPFVVEGNTIFLSGSVGVALGDDASSAEELLRNADTAMYRAKEEGRAGFAIYDDAMHASAAAQLTLQSALHEALDEGQLFLQYQPKVRLGDGATIGAEALLRWRHPKLGVVPPDRFVGVAEESGLICPIGAWVLQEACRTAAGWEVDGTAPLGIAVNISARQLADPAFLGIVQDALETSGLDPGLLTLEITESMVIRDPDRAAVMLRALSGIGVRISIDDFGTGQTSLAHLQRFPIDELKIDRSFVARLEHDAGGAAIVRAVVGLARALAIDVVAEGVETMPQMTELRRIGCAHAQGFLLSRPVFAPEIPRAVAKWAS